MLTSFSKRTGAPVKLGDLNIPICDVCDETAKKFKNAGDQVLYPFYCQKCNDRFSRLQQALDVIPDPPAMLHSQFERQEGGDHYRKLPYDLAKFAMEAGFDAMQFSAFKYICRLGLKGDSEKEVEDTKKAIHFLQMRLEHKHGVRSAIQYQHPTT